MGGPGRFVGVGIDTYDSHEPLEHAVAEVTAVAELLGGEFAGEPLLDPDQAQVTQYLKAGPGCLDTGPLVMLWCGHGVRSGSMLRLATRDAGGEINAAEVIYHCVKSGANQLLFSRAGDDETGEVTRAVALLEVATHDAGGSILTATFDALDHPSGFPELLDKTARDTERAATLLKPLATIALTAATTEPEAAVAGLHLAIAAAVTGDQDRATELISQALTWDPDSASAWIARLAQLGAAQPAVLPLITVLAEMSRDDEH